MMTLENDLRNLNSFVSYDLNALENLKNSVGYTVGLMFYKNLHNEGYYSHRFDSLSYLYLVFQTLVEHLLLLIHLWSYFLNILSERHMVCVHFESFIVLLCTSSILFIMIDMFMDIDSE